MSKARQLADLLDAGGDVIADALDNAPASDDASALTTGTLPAARVPYVGRRNYIINGSMQVSQRGTSFTGLTNRSSQYTLDRWKWLESGSANNVYSVEQSTDAPVGFLNSLKATVTTGGNLNDGNIYRMYYQMETKDLQSFEYGTADAKDITFSFWVKSSEAGGYSLALFNHTSGKICSIPYTINSAGTWERKTVTFPGDTQTSLSTNGGSIFSISFMMSVGANFKGTDATTWSTDLATRWAEGHTATLNNTNDYFALTGVQLELGSEATQFEHRTYDEELALCQRYYERYDGNIYPHDTDQPSGGHSFHMAFTQRKRSAPSITLGSGVNLDVLYARTDHDQLHGVCITMSHSSNSQGILQSPAWIADAEL